MNKKKSYLFGPFIGELNWEMFYFAPYAIYLKKNNPEIKIIVLTRSKRFDLYGQYADILIPLKIKEDNQNCFTMKDFLLSDYHRLIDGFRFKYRERFEIINHFYPDINNYRHKLKWQFPRLQMDYDFLPRKKNKIIIDNIQTEKIIFDDIWVDSTSMSLITSMLDENKYVYTRLSEIKNRLNESIDGLNTTYLGCVAKLLKRSEMVIGNMKSSITRLALLLGIPLISVNEKVNNDLINFLNPLKTKISYLEGNKNDTQKI